MDASGQMELFDFLQPEPREVPGWIISQGKNIEQISIIAEGDHWIKLRSAMGYHEMIPQEVFRSEAEAMQYLKGG